MLLVALAVVAMHQLGAGHQAMPSGHAVLATAPVMEVHPPGAAPTSMVAEMSWLACDEGCAATAAREMAMSGCGASMVCLAVLPLLLLLTRGRGALLGRWRRIRAVPAAAEGGRVLPVLALGPPGHSMLGLCVSRT